MNINTLGFLGFGKMGQALCLSLLEVYNNKKKFYAFDPALTSQTKKKFESLEFVKDEKELEKKSDIVFICVKPQDLDHVLKKLNGNKKYISIVAGVEISKIKSLLKNHECSVARVMPNLAIEIKKSLSAIYCSDKELLEFTKNIFSKVGLVFELTKEDLMHAFTVQCSSGPAIICAFIQAMSEGGVYNGLDFDLSLNLTLETIKSTISLLTEAEKKISPTELRNKVSSPSGVTIKALAKLEDKGWHGTIMNALFEASKRSRELSKT